MYIAYCSDIEAFKRDQLRSQDWSRHFPGSGWITCLYQLAAASGHMVVSGDAAIEHVMSRQWNPKDVYVIQDMDSKEGAQLLSLGAIPFLLICFEAALYAPFFYDRLAKLRAPFLYYCGFGLTEDHSQLSSTGKHVEFRFPSFYRDDLKPIESWNSRKKLVLVAANKYKTNKYYMPYKLSIVSFLRKLKWTSWQLISPAYRHALASSLHEKRLEMMEYFASKQMLEIYGAGWDDMSDLPRDWVTKLGPIFKRQYFGKCDDKLATIATFQFSICFENMASDYYVTEKIVDCFVAGTIPLYLGATNIEKIIPAESFVDMRKFSSFEQLEKYMQAMTEVDAMKLLNAGRNYLNTEVGNLHSYEGFAGNILELLTVC